MWVEGREGVPLPKETPPPEVCEGVLRLQREVGLQIFTDCMNIIRGSRSVSQSR